MFTFPLKFLFGVADRNKANSGMCHIYVQESSLLFSLLVVLIVQIVMHQIFPLK